MDWQIKWGPADTISLMRNRCCPDES